MLVGFHFGIQGEFVFFDKHGVTITTNEVPSDSGAELLSKQGRAGSTSIP